MTKKVVQFKPAAARQAAANRAPAPHRGPGAKPGSEPLRDADSWVAAAQPEDTAPPPVSATSPAQHPSELADSLGQLSREMSTLARAPLERNLAAAARLAACRSPAEALAAQSRLARDMMTGSLDDFARFAEASARAGRAIAATIERDPSD